MSSVFYCHEHNQVFFKRGQMKGYAHPIGEKIEGQKQQWCNMPEGQESEELPEETHPGVVEEHMPSQDNAMTKQEWADKDATTRTSIERQKALAEAVTWCGIKVQGGQDLRSADVITCAVMFEGYLKNGAVTKKTEPKPES